MQALVHNSIELPVTPLTLVTFDVPCARPGHFFDNASRRAKLVRILRAAFVAWSAASEAHQDLFTGFTSPASADLAQAEARCRHRYSRYAALESLLSEESGLPAFSIFNSISQQYPLCSRLLRAGL